MLKEDIVYVMITNFSDHWKNGRTKYTIELLKFDLQSHQLVENAPTLFIRFKEKPYEMEKAWFGYVSNFDQSVDNKGREIISFRRLLNIFHPCFKISNFKKEG
jgi:hypothetical protein